MFPNSTTRSARVAALARHNDQQETWEFGASFECRACLFSFTCISDSYDNVCNCKDNRDNQQDLGKKEKNKFCVVKQIRRFHIKDVLYARDVSEVTLLLRWDTAIYSFSLFINNITGCFQRNIY